MDGLLRLVREKALNATAAKNAPESTTRVLFWYHPDYLGNVDLVTERDGKTYEFFTYNPWGEEMHQYNANTFGFSSPYRFNAKEKDQETGLHYYGARYYQSKLSMWLSVDRLAEKYSNSSPFVFTANNAMTYFDPNGDSVLTSLAGYNVIQEALGRVLGDSHPFGFNENSGVLTFDFEADLSDYTSEQLEVIERIGSLVVSQKHNAVIYVAKRNEDVQLFDRTIKMSEYNHGEGGGANGLTLTATWKYPDGTISRTDSRVAIASDAINKWGRVYTDSRNASVHHEIGGHVYEDAFNPSLTESQRNRNTEKFEQLVRDIEINMSPIGGRAVKH